MRHGTYDLTDPALYSHGDPHLVWRRMREECPIGWHHRHGADGFWSVTGYEPGNVVLHTASTYSSERGVQLRSRLSVPNSAAGRTLVLVDPPKHGKLRGPLRKLFTPRSIAVMEPRARRVIRSLLRTVSGAGPCDFVGTVASRIPMAVMAELLGVEPKDVETMATLADAAGDESLDCNGLTTQEAHIAILMYYTDLLEVRRCQRSDDVMSALIGAQESGAAITDDEIVLTCENVFTASVDTTKSAIGSALLTLLDHPEQWSRLGGGVSLDAAVEEILRWVAPVTHVLRTASTPAVLGGVDIAAGDGVAVWLPSMNRDDAVFPDADKLRLDRIRNPHRTFGAGPHFCIGAPIVRLILRVFLEELRLGVGKIAAAGKPSFFPSYILSGPAALPVELGSR